MLEMVKDLLGLVIAVTVAPFMSKEDKEEDILNYKCVDSLTGRKGEYSAPCYTSKAPELTIGGLKFMKKNYDDLIGQTFNNLTILEVHIEKQGNRNRTMAKCQCSCGNVVSRRLEDVKAGRTKSCGCLTKQILSKANLGNFEDLTGRTFSRLTVLETYRKNNYTYCKCQCSCGKICTVRATSLKNGTTKSCGCLSRELKKLDNQKFGELLVIETFRKNKETYCKCQCTCGNIKVISKKHLMTGKVLSCGCKTKRHGKSGTKLYKCWAGIKDRCYNKNNKGYKNYGGRGITVCEEWLNDFQAFYDWAMNNGYDETAPRGQYTIDRINNDGNYEPSNCRWITIQEQQFNKSNNHNIEYGGVKLCLKKWADKLGMSKHKILSRLRNGWTVEDALEETKKSVLLGYDYSLWAEFNKEQLIRKWIESSRTCYLRRGDDDIPTEGVEVECGTHMERVMAENALEELINFGHLDPVTYLKTPKADETHEVY